MGFLFPKEDHLAVVSSMGRKALLASTVMLMGAGWPLCPPWAPRW